MKKNINIVFYGTHLQHFYVAKWLREKGYNCTLVLTSFMPKSMPEAADPDLKDDYPDWIVDLKNRPDSFFRRLLRYLASFSFVPLSLQRFLCYFELNPQKKAKKLIDKADLVFTSGTEGLLHSFKFSKPVLFRALGSDLCKAPFSSDPLCYTYLAYEIRKNISSISKIMLYQIDTIWASRFLGVSSNTFLYSLPTDIDSLHSNIDSEFYDQVAKRYQSYNVVFFMPSRKNMDPDSTDYKGCEKALRVFARMKAKGDDFLVVASARGVHGARFIEKVNELNISGIVDIVDEEPAHRLMAYIKQPNFIVVNDLGFKKQHMTGIARESVSMGALLVDSVDTGSELFNTLYGPKEKLNVFECVEETDLFKVLRYLVQLTEEQRNLAQDENLTWAKMCLDKSNNLNKLEKLIHGML